MFPLKGQPLKARTARCIARLLTIYAKKITQNSSAFNNYTFSYSSSAAFCIGYSSSQRTSLDAEEIGVPRQSFKFFFENFLNCSFSPKIRKLNFIKFWTIYEALIKLDYNAADAANWAIRTNGNSGIINLDHDFISWRSLPIFNHIITLATLGTHLLTYSFFWLHWDKLQQVVFN